MAVAHRTYLREMDPENADTRHMHRVLLSLRDEVRAVMFERHRGNSRELAMVATKLEEAYQWSVAYGVATGSHRIIDTRELLGGSPDVGPED